MFIDHFLHFISFIPSMSPVVSINYRIDNKCSIFQQLLFCYYSHHFTCFSTALSAQCGWGELAHPNDPSTHCGLVIPVIGMVHVYMLMWHGHDILLHTDDSICLNTCTNYQDIPLTVLNYNQSWTPDVTDMLPPRSSLSADNWHQFFFLVQV